jgi:hypothetical protein
MYKTRRRSFMFLTRVRLLHLRSHAQGGGRAATYCARYLPKKPLKTLSAIEQIGYREVELTADNLDAMLPSLKHTSLKAIRARLIPNGSSVRSRNCARRNRQSACSQDPAIKLRIPSIG